MILAAQKLTPAKNAICRIELPPSSNIYEVNSPLNMGLALRYNYHSNFGETSFEKHCANNISVFIGFRF